MGKFFFGREGEVSCDKDYRGFVLERVNGSGRGLSVLLIKDEGDFTPTYKIWLLSWRR